LQLPSFSFIYCILENNILRRRWGPAEYSYSGVRAATGFGPLVGKGGRKMGAKDRQIGEDG